MLHGLGLIKFIIFKLDLMDLSNKMKYENITQAVPLSPRVLNKAEKREPVQRRPHICKGCKDGGLLPWL